LTLGSAGAAPARLATCEGPFWLPARPEPLPEKAITSVDLNAAPKPGPSRQLNSPGGSSIRRGSALEPDGWGQAGSDHTTCWPESALLRQTATAVSESPSRRNLWLGAPPERGYRAGASVLTIVVATSVGLPWPRSVQTANAYRSGQALQTVLRHRSPTDISTSDLGVA
jgi:hypothetical protein